jgi:hypothetical protein
MKTENETLMEYVPQQTKPTCPGCGRNLTRADEVLFRLLYELRFEPRCECGASQRWPADTEKI